MKRKKRVAPYQRRRLERILKEERGSPLFGVRFINNDFVVDVASMLSEKGGPSPRLVGVALAECAREHAEIIQDMTGQPGAATLAEIMYHLATTIEDALREALPPKLRPPKQIQRRKGVH